MRLPFDTPQRRKPASEHADSSKSGQKHSQETRLKASDTLSTGSSEGDTSNKTNEGQHSDSEETLETHQHNTPNEERKPEDIQRRNLIRCGKVQSKTLFMKEDTRQRITQSVRNNIVCLFGFLTSSSTTRLYRGRAPRQSV